VIRRNTQWHITRLECENLEFLTAKSNFTTIVNNCLGDPIKDYLELNELVKVTLSNDESINLTDMSYDPEVMDSYLTADFLLPRRDKIKLGKVVCCLSDENNLPRGKENYKPILDTWEYVVAFDDGAQLEYAAKIIAENIYAQVNTEGKKYMILDSIITLQR
jgi:hypothetical protein